MIKANLPTEDAFEPDEEARQPLVNVNIAKSTLETNTRKRFITFAHDDDDVEKSGSQNSSSYKEALSQPPPGVSHRLRLQWIQKRRAPGLWAQCDDCHSWRYLPAVIDSHELPKRWYCRLNPDKAAADCSIAEAPICVREEEDLIHSEYSAGSVVWARMAGWPWWPAMVDDCPDAEQFYWLDGLSDIPTHYNVVFFDTFDVTRAWISPGHLKPYASNKSILNRQSKQKKYNKRLEVAVTQADDAEGLSLTSRLAKYSFLTRYKGAIGSPKKINRKDLIKYQKQLKRKYNIDFPIEDSDSDEEELNPKKTNANKQSAMEPEMVKPKSTVTGGASEFKKSATEKDNATSEINSSKQPDSMAVQIGSTFDSAGVNIDDDSSKTYIPENTESQTESQDTRIFGVATVSSDD